jgi:hypothetical protein
VNGQWQTKRNILLADGYAFIFGQTDMSTAIAGAFNYRLTYPGDDNYNAAQTDDCAIPLSVATSLTIPPNILLMIIAALAFKVGGSMPAQPTQLRGPGTFQRTYINGSVGL